jgi:hypothetical protein
MYINALVNAHVWVRTHPFFAPFVNDTNELKKYVKSVMMHQGGHQTIHESEVQEIVDTAGSNLAMLTNLSTQSDTRKAVEEFEEEHPDQLRILLGLSNQAWSASIREEDRQKAFDLLLRIANGDIVRMNYDDDIHRFFLSRHNNIDAICGTHPEGHLVFAMPVTQRAILKLKQERSNKLWSWWR